MIDGVRIKLRDIVLAAGADDLTNDAGIKEKLGSIGDFVWDDTDSDGVQDTGEPGVQDVTVKLYKKTGDVLVGTKTTSAAGAYLFDNLSADTYYVIFSNLPSGYEFTTANAGTDDAKDSDANTTTGKTGDIVLAAGADDLTNDARIKEKLGSARAEVSNPQGDKDVCDCGKGQEGRCEEEESS